MNARLIKCEIFQVECKIFKLNVRFWNLFFFKVNVRFFELNVRFSSCIYSRGKLLRRSRLTVARGLRRSSLRTNRGLWRTSYHFSGEGFPGCLVLVRFFHNECFENKNVNLLNVNIFNTLPLQQSVFVLYKKSIRSMYKIHT